LEIEAVKKIPLYVSKAGFVAHRGKISNLITAQISKNFLEDLKLLAKLLE
jgi:hypothetical protein